MSSRLREANKAPRPVTVLDPLRPAVVVRRRVYDSPLEEKDAPALRTFTSTSRSLREDIDEENGPPSSINVARALASLRSDELQRVEDLLRADEEAPAGDDDEDFADEPADERRLSSDEEAPDDRAPLGAGRVPSSPSVVSSVSASSPSSASSKAPSKPTLVVGRSIPLVELARRMGVSSEELPVTLVTKGFYALTSRAIVGHETACTIAELFGWRVEELAPELDDSPHVNAEAPPRKAPSPPSRRASKSRSSGKVSASAKSAKRAKPRASSKARPGAKTRPNAKVRVSAKARPSTKARTGTKSRAVAPPRPKTKTKTKSSKYPV